MAVTDERALEYYYKKFDTPHPPLTSEQAKALKVAEHMARSLFPGSQHLVKPATHDEVMRAMKPDTACGFPFVGDQYPDKASFMQLHEPVVASQWRQKHEVFTTVAYKVEPLSKEKIQRKGCRILRYADVLTIYKQMRLTYRLLEVLHTPMALAKVSWPLTPLLYGFSEQYGGWDKVHRAFDAYKVFGLDGSSYDTSLHPELLRAVARIIRRCLELTHEEHELYWHLCESLIVSKCVDNRGKCYELSGSNCTGQYWTKLWNDLCTLISILYSMIRATGDSGTNLMNEWLDRCRAAISGDDALIGIKTDGVPELPQDLVLYSAELGVKIELEFDGPNVKFAPSYGLTFLSTSTVFVPKYGYLPLHQIGKTLCKLAHARMDQRTPEARYNRLRGAYITLWPHKFTGEVGHAVVEKLKAAFYSCRDKLSQYSPLRLDDVSDIVMVKLYTGIELQSKTVGPVKEVRFKDVSQVYGMPPKSKQPRSMPKAKPPKVSKQLQVRQTRRNRKKSRPTGYVNEQAQGFSTVDRVNVVRQTGSMLLPNEMQPVLTEPINTLGTGALVVPPILLSPLMMGNNRLALQASLYSEWKPRSLKLRYVPKVGQFNNGGFLMVYSRDPSYLPVEYTSSTSAVNVMSLQLCSEQGTKCNTFVASRGTLNCVQPSKWKDGWLKCSASNVAGIISSLFSAGIVYFIMDGAVTNNTGAALTGQVGELWLDWDIDFRGETDNVIARSLSQVVNDLTISSVAGIASGASLQFTLNTESGSTNYLGNDVLVIYPGADFSGTGFSFAENAPMYLRRTGTNLYFLAYNTLYDAVNATTGRTVTNSSGSVSTPVTVDVATVQPMPQLTFG